MADGADQLVRAFVQLTGALVEQAARLAIRIIERRAELLRQAAAQGERQARVERARLAGHHAADAAIWRRTTDPRWWRTADERHIAAAWRAASTWHHVDADAAGAREVIAQRLRRRGVDVSQDVTANPGDVRWLATALDLARAEREELAALAADLDIDYAEVAAEVLWHAEEQPAPAERAMPRGEPDRVRRADAAAVAAEIVWNDDEPLAGQRRQHQRGRDTSHASPVAAVTDTTPAATALAEVAGIAAQHPDTRQEPSAGGVGTQAGVPAAARSRHTKRSTLAMEPDRPRRHTAVDLSTMENMLRQAWPNDKANRVIGDAAWPALASTMQNLTAAGKDVPRLLGELPFDTTDGKVPAVLTQWALRHAATGPVALRWAQQQRQTQQQRLATLQRHALMADDVHERGDAHDATEQLTPGAAQRLHAAYPTTTMEALNRRAAATMSAQQRPEPMTRQRTNVRDRAESETAAR
jgi:hypothetical protein